MFFIIGVLQKFRNRKTLVLESLFIKVAVLKVCNFMKKRLQHRPFPVNNAKFLRTAFFINTSGGYFCRFDKVNCYGASVDFLFLIKNTMWDGFYQQGLQIFSLHIVSRNHSDTFLLINLQKIKICSN